MDKTNISKNPKIFTVDSQGNVLHCKTLVFEEHCEKIYLLDLDDIDVYIEKHKNYLGFTHAQNKKLKDLENFKKVHKEYVQVVSELEKSKPNPNNIGHYVKLRDKYFDLKKDYLDLQSKLELSIGLGNYKPLILSLYSEKN